MKQVNLIGKKVTNVRSMTEKEMISEGWDGRGGTVIEFNDGTLIYASRDEEGNGPGCLFGISNGDRFGYS
jgi:hypothetical protein